MFSKVFLLSKFRFQVSSLKYIFEQEMQLQCECILNPDLEYILQSCNGQASKVLCMWDYQGFQDGMLWQSINGGGWELNRRSFTFVLYNVPRGSGIEKEALSKGIHGVFYDEDDLELIKKAVNVLYKGEYWYPRRTLCEYIANNGSGKNQDMTRAASNLTPREVEILRMIAGGYTNSQIAEFLFVSPSTVKTHVYNIFQKIKVPNRIQAALWSVKYLYSPDEQKNNPERQEY